MVKLNLKGVFSALASEQRRVGHDGADGSNAIATAAAGAADSSAHGAGSSAVFQPPERARSKNNVASPPPRPPVRVGDIVFLHGLEKKPQYNFHVCEVCVYIPSSGRYGVKAISHPGAQRSLRAGSRAHAEKEDEFFNDPDDPCEKVFRSFRDFFEVYASRDVAPAVRETRTADGSPRLVTTSTSTGAFFYRKMLQDDAIDAGRAGMVVGSEGGSVLAVRRENLTALDWLGRPNVESIRTMLSIGGDVAEMEKKVDDHAQDETVKVDDSENAIGATGTRETSSRNEGKAGAGVLAEQSEEQGGPADELEDINKANIVWKHIVDTKACAALPFRRLRLAALCGEDFASLLQCATMGRTTRTTMMSASTTPSTRTDLPASFPEAALVLERILSEPLALQIASFLLVPRAGVPERKRVFEKLQAEVPTIPRGLSAFSWNGIFTNTKCNLPDTDTDSEEHPTVRESDRVEEIKIDTLDQHCKPVKKTSRTYVHASSHRGDFPLETVQKNAGNGGWFISGGSIRRTGPVRLRFSFCLQIRKMVRSRWPPASFDDKNFEPHSIDVEDHSKWCGFTRRRYTEIISEMPQFRRCRMMALRMPALPQGPLSVRKFFLRARVLAIAPTTQGADAHAGEAFEKLTPDVDKVQEGEEARVNIDKEQKSAQQQAQEAVQNQKDHQTEVEEDKKLEEQQDQEEDEDLHPQTEDEDEEASVEFDPENLPEGQRLANHAAISEASFLPQADDAEDGKLAWQRIPQNEGEFFETLDTSETQFFAIEPAVDCCEVEMVMVSNAADEKDMPVGLYYAGFG